MAKGQKRSSREVRKPKANKPVVVEAATFLGAKPRPAPTGVPKKKS